MTTHGHHMEREIRAQPTLLAGLLHDRRPIERVAGELARRQPRFVLFAARGTSDHAALYGKYLVEVELGLPTGLASPSTTTLYGATLHGDGVLFIAISQSGASPDLVDALAAARRGGATTVAITNDAGSALAEAAEFAIDIRAGAELAVAATKTYTTELLALNLLITGLSGHRDDPGLTRLPEAAERTLLDDARLDELTGRWRDAATLIVTGRGFAYPTACEAALKLMETAYLPAHAYSGADLLHGPVAMVQANTSVLTVMTPGRGGDAMRPVLKRLTAVQADVVQVGLGSGLPVVTDGIGEGLHPILQILPLQRLAHRLAVARGYDPDQPRGLTKVTRTR